MPANGPNRLLPVTLAAVLLVAGCAVKFVADYDPVLDEGIAELATGVDAFLSRMERTAGTTDGTYAANAGFYADTAAALRTYRVRAEASPKSGKVVAVLDLALDSLEELRGVHEGRGDGGLPAAAVAPTRSGLETQFRAIFAIESALRRGE